MKDEKELKDKEELKGKLEKKEAQILALEKENQDLRRRLNERGITKQQAL